MATANPIHSGQKAPDFALHEAPDRSVTLSDFVGQRVVLVFYPADFSPVCSDQLAVYSELRDEWKRRGVQLFAISVDGPWCHRAFRDERHIAFPLLSDFEPKGEVARRYGVYDTREGSCERALFVIDKGGTIAWSYLSPVDVNPGADGILDALDALDRAQGASA